MIKKEIIARFDCPIEKIVKPSKKEREEILASIGDDEYKKLVPADFDITTDDFIFVYGGCFTPSFVNKNGHIIDNPTALKLAKQIKFRFLDLEHERREIIGCLLNYSFSSFPPNKSLSLEDVQKLGNAPFTVNALGVVWDAIDPDVVDLLLESGLDKNSPRYRIAAFSWELKASEFLICVGGKALQDARIITDPQEEEFYSKYLKSEGGLGIAGGEYVYSLLVNPIFQGLGVVRKPAAEVEPLTVFSPNPDTLIQNDNPKKENDNNEEGEKENPPSKQLCSTQFNLNEVDAEPVLKFVDTIPPEQLYIDRAGYYGKETQPHITALYGIKGDQKVKIAKLLKDAGPISCTLGEISAFKNDNKPYDVLKVDVKGDVLHSIHNTLKNNLDYENEFDEYHPHLTLAYMKKGATASYEGKKHFLGKKLTFPALHFADENRNQTPIDISVFPPEKKQSISQTKNASVIISEQKIVAKNNVKPSYYYRFMKFEKIEELSAALKNAGVDEEVVKANARFIEEELAKRSETYKSSVQTLEDKNKANEAKLAALSDDVKKMEDEKGKIMEAFKSLKDKQDEMEKQARFNQRMAALDADYNLDDEDRAAVTPNVRDMDDACYSSWMKATFMPLARGKKKVAPPVDKKADEDDGWEMPASEKGKKDTVKASKKDDKKEEKTEKVDDKKEEEKEASAKKADDDNDKVVKMENEQKEENKKNDKEHQKAAEELVASAIQSAEVDKKETVIPNGVSQIQQSLREKYKAATSLDTVTFR